jgi:tetratricopeptide (TPR) repeat protein
MMCNETDRQQQSEDLFAKAQNLYESGKPEQAVPILQRILAEFREFCILPAMHYWLGISLYYADRVPEAHQVLAAYFAIPDSPREGFKYVEVLSHLALCWWEQDEFEEVLKCLDLSEPHYRNYDVPNWHEHWFMILLLRGEALVQLEQYDEAIKVFDSAKERMSKLTVDQQVNTAVLGYNIGRALFLSGNLTDAGKELGMVDVSNLPAASKQPYYRDMLRFSLWTDKYSDGISFFEALDTLGIPEDYLAEAHHWVGRAHYLLGHGMPAKHHFEESRKSGPSETWITEKNEFYLNELAKAGF